MSEHKLREKNNVVAGPMRVKASEDDRCWFLAHPLRSYRLRWEVKGEWWGDMPAPQAARRMILVKQLEPGSRFRTSLTPPNEGTGQELIDLSEGRVIDCPDGKTIYVNDQFLETLFHEGWLPLRHPEKDGTDGLGIVLRKILGDDGNFGTFDEAVEAAKRNATKYE